MNNHLKELIQENMNDIIKALKKHPNWDLSMIALSIRETPTKAAEAQRIYLRPFLNRNSNKWGARGTSVTK
jgi:hypothetical protein